MKSLFGDNRQADILSLMRGGTSLSIDLLAQKLSVSDRTIRNDIKTINETLGDSGIIETDQGICSLRIFDVDSFQTAYSHIIATDDLMNSPSRRMDYIFGKLMFSFSPVLTDDLAYEMNVGRTTLIKDLKKLRKTIEPYNLSIIGKTSQGLILQGSEINIRRYVIENCYDSDSEVYENKILLSEYSSHQIIEDYTRIKEQIAVQMKKLRDEEDNFKRVRQKSRIKKLIQAGKIIEDAGLLDDYDPHDLYLMLVMNRSILRKSKSSPEHGRFDLMKGLDF